MEKQSRIDRNAKRRGHNGCDQCRIGHSASAKIAKGSARSAKYKYLHSWVGKSPMTGELTYFWALNGIISMDIELPDYTPPENIPVGRKESTLVSIERMVNVSVDTDWN